MLSIVADDLQPCSVSKKRTDDLKIKALLKSRKINIFVQFTLFPSIRLSFGQSQRSDVSKDSKHWKRNRFVAEVFPVAGQKNSSGYDSQTYKLRRTKGKHLCEENIPFAVRAANSNTEVLKCTECHEPVLPGLLACIVPNSNRSLFVLSKNSLLKSKNLLSGLFPFSRQVLRENQ